MKKFLPLLCIFITSCSLEVGSDYDDKRLPVDNKTYLMKQKRERYLLSKKHIEKNLSKKKRYDFRDSERPVMRQQAEADYEDESSLVDYKTSNGCQWGTPCEETIDSVPRYPNMVESEEVYVPDEGYRSAHKRHKSSVREHRPRGDYHVHRKENTVKIKPKPHTKPVVSDTQSHKAKPVISAPHPIKKKVVTSEHVVYQKPPKNDAHNISAQAKHSSDDEGITTIPPKIVTHDNMPKDLPVVPKGSNTNKPGQVAPSQDNVPSSTVNDANKNIANIRSQIESKNLQNKQHAQSSTLNTSEETNSVHDQAMHKRLQQLQELTSQNQEANTLPTDGNLDTSHGSNKIVQKGGSQEVRLPLDSSSGANSSSGGSVGNAEIPPPAGLVQ